MPTTVEQWKVIAEEYERRWNYPHCLGAIDGKHVVIVCPDNSGSLYYNYKHQYSIVLLALVDAHYKFLGVDIGAYGRSSDAGVFANTNLGRSITPPNSLHFPDPQYIEGAREFGKLPYVVLGDEAFPLQVNLMRPYPGKTATLDQTVYNYRHSRARRTVENAFGILASRWRVYHSKISVLPETTTKIVQATVVLHNMMQTEAPFRVQQEDILADGLIDLPNMGYRGTDEAINIREKFTKYIKQVPLAWQNGYVQRGLTNY